MKSQSPVRRNDIDILRAIAVMAVLLFHLDLEWIPGGYLGVDVFFVISGYLITGSIVSQLQSGSFSFLKFYARRTRRLMPALFATLLVSSAAAMFFLPQSLQPDFINSLVTSATYTSNVYFFLQSGYFDLESTSRPFLHTWSLSVEEQFYLVWPAMLLLLARSKLPFFLCSIGLISIISAQLMHSFSSSASFYLFPFRIFEFCAGAICIFVSSELLACKKYTRAACIALAFLAIFSSFVVLTETTPMPGVWSLPVVTGTSLLILLRPQYTFLHPYLLGPIRYIGLISYSVYLVHWPLIIFYKFSSDFTLEHFEALSLGLITIGLGSILYHLVEYRWHYSTRAISINRSLWLIPMGVAGAIALSAVLVPLSRILAPNTDVIQMALEPIAQYRKKAVIPIITGVDYERNPEGGKTILVVGDSHSADIKYALWKNLEPNWNLKSISRACHPIKAKIQNHEIEALYVGYSADAMVGIRRSCVKFHDAFLSLIGQEKPSLVIFSENWRMESLPYLEETLRAIREELGTPILVLGRNVTLNEPPQLFVARLNDTRDINVVANKDQIAMPQNISNAHLDNLLQDISQRSGAYFISKTELVCPGGYCEIFANGAVTYVDRSHWSLEGMTTFGLRLVSNSTFKEFVSSPN